MIDRTNEKNKKHTLHVVDVCRCTRAGLKSIQCPSGLAFDIEKQTCDWKAKVTNCDKKESKFRRQQTKQKKKQKPKRIDIFIFVKF